MTRERVKKKKKTIPQLKCCVWIGLLESVVSVVQARVVYKGVFGIYSEACDVGWNIVFVDGREKTSEFLNLFQEMTDYISRTMKRYHCFNKKIYNNGFHSPVYVRSRFPALPAVPAKQNNSWSVIIFCATSLCYRVHIYRVNRDKLHHS